MQVVTPAAYVIYTAEHVLREPALYKGSVASGEGARGGREGLEACQASMFDDFVLKFQCTAAAAAADVAGTTNEGSPMRR